MPSNITPSATWDTTIPTPDNGEGATGAGLDGFAQPIANRTEYLKSVVEGTGIKKIRAVTSLANLKALTGVAHNEVVLMNDATLGVHLYVYHSTAALTPDDVLVVTATSMGAGQYLSALQSGMGIANGLAVYNASGKLGLGKVTNQIVELNDVVLGSLTNVTATSYTTVLNKVLSSTINAGDKIRIDAHGTLKAVVGASTCYSRLAVSENGGSDIAISGTEDAFDSSYTGGLRRSYSRLHTVTTGGTFEVRWQLKSGAVGNAASIELPAAITITVVRP